MGQLPDIVLTRLRSPGKALYDLVEKYESLACNDPVRDDIGRMIRQLAAAITESIRIRAVR
jgi:hypothetical protein